MKQQHFQRGNVTLLTVFLFAIAGLAVLGLYNVGQQTTTKVRLQTVSDAAAHSVATIVARDLNFKAYTNRAMVANQIAIAQMVGLASWAQMFHRAATNIGYVATALSWIPAVGQILKAIATAIERGASIVNNAIDRAAPVVVRAEEFLIDGLAAGQLAFHGATLVMAKETLSGVVSESDSDIDTAALASNGIFWGSFVRTWEGRQERYKEQTVGNNSAAARENRERLNEFRDVTKASGDPFVNHRTYAWLPTFTLPFVVRVRMEKYGGSELMPGTTSSRKGNYQWTAMDSVGFEQATYKWGLRPGWRKWGELFPVGWGAAHALIGQGNYYNYSASSGNKELWGQGTWRLPITTGLGAAEEGSNNLTRTKGLRPFYDLKARGRVQDDYLTVQVLLLKRSDKVRTTATMTAGVQGYQTQPAFNVEERGGMAGDTMASLAKAGVYFYRPNEADWRRNDGQREFGNLYNPYWQVRLMPSSNTERTAALAFAQIRM